MEEEFYVKVYLFRKNRVPPIEIARNSQLKITIETMDYTVPVGATASAFAKGAFSDKVYTQSCTVDGNRISFIPEPGFFVQGRNILQYEIGDSVIPLAIDVNCEISLPDEGDATKPDSVKPYIQRAEVAAEKSEAAAARAQEVKDSIPEDYTKLSDGVNQLKDDLDDKFKHIQSDQLFNTDEFLIGKALEYQYGVSTPADLTDDDNWVTTNIITKEKGKSITYATNITKSGIVALGYNKNSSGNYVRSDYYPKVTSGENYNTLTFAEDSELIRISILKSQYEAISKYLNGIYLCEETKWSTDLSRKYINETHLTNTKVKEEDIITENPINYNGNEVNVFFYGIACGDSLTEGTFNTESGYENHKQYAYPMMFTKKTGVTLRNFGVGGSTAKSWYERYQNVEFPIYDFAIIAFGVNDLLQGVENTTITYLKNIVDKLKSKNPKVKCFIATVNKAYKSASANYNALNDNIRNFANTTDGCYLLDIAKYGLTEDGTNFVNGHLTAIGYNELAREFANLISWNIQNNMSDFTDIQFSGTTHTTLPTD